MVKRSITSRNISSINNNIRTVAKTFGTMSAQYENAVQGLRGLDLRETSVNGERVIQVRDTKNNRKQSARVRARKNANININNAKRRAQKATKEYNEKNGTDLTMQEYTNKIQRNSEYQQERYELAEFLRSNEIEPDMSEMMNNEIYYDDMKILEAELKKQSDEGDTGNVPIPNNIKIRTTVNEDGHAVVFNAETSEVIYEYD